MNNPEVLDGLVGLILAVSIICVILSEWLNDPHVLASSSDCLFFPCQSPAELWACLRTSSAPFQCNFSCFRAGNKTVQRGEFQNHLRIILQECWQTFYSAEKISSWDCWPFIQGEIALIQLHLSTAVSVGHLVILPVLWHLGWDICAKPDTSLNWYLLHQGLVHICVK